MTPAPERPDTSLDRFEAVVAYLRAFKETLHLTTREATDLAAGIFDIVEPPAEGDGMTPAPERPTSAYRIMLKSAISGERRDWHRVEVDPGDIEAALTEIDRLAAAPAPDAGLRKAVEDVLGTAIRIGRQTGDFDAYAIPVGVIERLRAALSRQATS